MNSGSADGMETGLWSMLLGHFFTEAFGESAESTWFAPGGLTLFGDAAQSLAIPVRWGATVGATERDDDMVQVRSINAAHERFSGTLDQIGDAPPWARPSLEVFAAMRQAGHQARGVNLLTYTILPQVRGLPAAAGLASASGIAFHHSFGGSLTAAQWAALGAAGAQIASLCCPPNQAALVDETRPEAAEMIPFDLAGADLRLLVIDFPLALPATAGRPAGTAAEAASMLRAGEIAGIGPLLDHHGAMPDKMAEVASAARSAGALGAGPSGGDSRSGQSCLVALVPLAAVGPVRAAVRRSWPMPRPPRFLTTMSTREGTPTGVAVA